MTTHLCPSARQGKDHDARGFSLLELITVMMVSLAIAAVAIPGYISIMRNLRIAGDSRDLDGLVAQAKMRDQHRSTEPTAVADFAQLPHFFAANLRLNPHFGANG